MSAGYIQTAIIDAFLGFLMLCTNLTIFVFIQMHRTVRKEKEYVLLGLLVLANSVLGCALLYQSVHMLYYRVGNNSTIHLHQQCAAYPHIVLIPGLVALMSFMLPFMALDRFIAVVRPMYYFTMERCCALRLASLLLLIYGSYTVTATFFLREGPTSWPYCHMLINYQTQFVVSTFVLFFLGHLTTVIIYIGVIVALRRQIDTMHSLCENGELIISSSSMESGREKVIRTFAVFAGATFLFTVLPSAFLLFIELHMLPDGHLTDSDKDEITALRIILKLFQLNPTFNVVAYALKHKQIYQGLRQVVENKRESLRSLHTQRRRKRLARQTNSGSAVFSSAATV